MGFQVIKILDTMRELYKMPKSKERFDRYLYLLQGEEKDEMILPIAGFNPMANDFAVSKLEQLIDFSAEDVAQEEIERINIKHQIAEELTIKVALNLVDDIGGVWSNYFTTDYKSKFEFDSILKRNFCTPHFWTSEKLSKKIIADRVNEYVLRTIYWLNNTSPATLEQILAQEVFVQTYTENTISHDKANAYSGIKLLHEKYKQSTDYNLIFNFFYGDIASEGLAYKQYGVKGKNGFEYAKFLNVIQSVTPLVQD